MVIICHCVFNSHPRLHMLLLLFGFSAVSRHHIRFYISLSVHFMCSCSFFIFFELLNRRTELKFDLARQQLRFLFLKDCEVRILQ